MEQYSATCPHCNFVLQFYDASLFGRKGRCPKCRNKFVLNREGAPPVETPRVPEEPEPQKQDIDSATADSENKTKSKPATPAPPKPPARAATVAAEKPASVPNETLEIDVNRGLGLRRPTLPARWVLPNVLSITNLLIIAIGASTGMGAISLFVNDCPVYFLAMASTVGGLIATGFLIRRYDPQDNQ